MRYEDLPKSVRDRFQVHGVDGLFDCVRTDLLSDGTFGTVWMGRDSEKLYILSGKDEPLPRRKKSKTPPSFEETDFRVCDLSDLGQCKVERFFTTARAVAQPENGEPKELLCFTLSRADDVAGFLQKMQPDKEGEPGGNREKRERPRGNKKRKTTILRLLSMFRFYIKELIGYFIVLFLVTAFSLLSPYVGTKILYDNVLSPGDPWYGQVGAFLAMLIGVRLIALILSITEKKLFSADLAPRLTYDLKTRIFTAMQRLSVGFYTDKQTGALMNRVYDDADHVYWFFVDLVPFFVLNAAQIAGILIVMFRLSPALTGIVLCVLPLIGGVYYVVSRMFRKLHRRTWIYRSAMVSQVSDTVSGQRIVKVFDKEKEEAARFASYSDRLRRAYLHLGNLQDTLLPLMSVLTVAANMTVLATGGILLLNNSSFTLGTLMTFTAYLNMIYAPLEEMSQLSNALMRCVDSAERIFEVVDAQPDIQESEHPVSLPDLKGDVELKNVMFEYEPGHPVIKDLSLHVPAGHMVGIVGKTGAGKSTIANLIARLYDVREGCVTIDGVDVRDLAVADLRRNIGIVSQEIYLFMGSVADNIRYARPEASNDEVIAAAKAAAAHDFIIKLPDGYETVIGAGGQDLSGGEKQRISIARAILQDPRILILDEATASMDTVTERKIQQALTELQKDRTTISIAHRLSTLRDADELAVIENGAMTEYGTHEELIRRKGAYYELYKLQAEAMKTIAVAE